MRAKIADWRGSWDSSLARVKKWDQKWIGFIQRLRLPIWDKRMLTVTRLGDGGLIWFMVVALLLPWRDHAASMLLLAILVSTAVSSLIIKPLCSRSRPFESETSPFRILLTPKDPSFPSGHAMTSFAAATMIFHTSVLLGIPALALAGCIAFSRLYLFLHYPSDVIIGAILGVLCTTVML
jgi:undecaprenyl-diphosphatase